MPYPEVGKRFAYERELLGLTQEKFAEISGFSVKLIQKTEAGGSIRAGTHNDLLSAINKLRSKRTPPLPPIDIHFRGGAPSLTHEGSKSGTAFIVRGRPTVAPLSNPHQLAMLEALRHTAPVEVRAKLRVGDIRTDAEIETLWTIDNAAYGDGNITLEHFRALWMAYPQGLHVLYHEDEILGAMGIWPVTERWASKLKSARLKEAELDANTVAEAARNPPCYWYITGLMLREELIGRGGGVKNLLNGALSIWLHRLKVGFPCEILALAYSEDGDRLLQRFGFPIAQHAHAMPDKIPLYRLYAVTKREMICLLRARNLDLGTNNH